MREYGGKLCAGGLCSARAPGTLALTLLLAAIGFSPHLAAREASQQSSGGRLLPEQRALRIGNVDLALDFDPVERSIAGRATLHIVAAPDAPSLTLDLDQRLIVDSIVLDGIAVPRSGWRHEDGRIGLDIPATSRRPSGGRILDVSIAYHGTPQAAVRAPWDDGMVWSKTPDGQPWIASTAQSSGCDLYWPCIDYPTFEPDFIDLHLTVPRGLKAPSNGVLLGVDTLPDGRTTWHWHAKTPTLYTIAFNIGPYDEMSGVYRSRFGNQIPMFYWFLPGDPGGARQLFDEFAPTLDFYERIIGPYPFGDQKMAVVETPFRGMEHQTITAYGTHHARSPEGFDKLFHHEFGHEWFANQLTAADWDDFWLHEGFDAYMQPLYGRWREGEARYAAMMLEYRRRIRNRFPLVSRTSRASGAVYDPATGPANDIYLKGAWVLHSLRELIGDEDFFAAVRILVYGRADPRPGNFKPVFRSSADFIAIVNDVTGRDYRWFFDAYLYQAALPRLDVEQRGGILALNWSLPDGRVFPMPVEVEIDGKVRRVAMRGGAGRIAVSPTSHVVIDPQAKLLRQSDAIDAYQSWLDRQDPPPKP